MNVQLKFDNARKNGADFLIDIVGTSSAPMKIYGINLRFWYDATVFKFGNASTCVLLAPGYKTYGPNSSTSPAFGNSPAGWKFFDGATSKPATYVNGNVELVDKDRAVELRPVVYTKICTVKLVPQAPITGYIPFILDKIELPDPATGGTKVRGFQNNPGLVITEYLGEQNGTAKTGPTKVTVEYTNFLHFPGDAVSPFGRFVEQTHFNL